MPRPEHLSIGKRFLEKEFGATWSKNQEADDDIGIEVFRDLSVPCIIAHIDKDLNQFPGTHYNYNKKVHYTVSERQAQNWFVHQMVLGDRSDNIPGIDGLMRKEYPKKFQYIYETIEMEDNWIEQLRYVWDLYNQHGLAERFHDNADCLWLLKAPNMNWKKLEIEV